MKRDDVPLRAPPVSSHPLIPWDSLTIWGGGRSGSRRAQKAVGEPHALEGGGTMRDTKRKND